MNEISLKFGRLKSTDLESSESIAIEKRYCQLEQGPDPFKLTDEEKKVLCELIQSVDKIYCWWRSRYLTKQEAIDYVMNYGTEKEKQL